MTLRRRTLRRGLLDDLSAALSRRTAARPGRAAAQLVPSRQSPRHSKEELQIPVNNV